MRITLSAEAVQALQLLVGSLLPAVVALVTRRLATSRSKALVLTGLAAITAISSQLMAPEGFVVMDVASGFIRTFVAGVAVHYGLLKPTGVTGEDGMVVAARGKAVRAVTRSKPPRKRTRRKPRKSAGRARSEE